VSTINLTFITILVSKWLEFDGFWVSSWGMPKLLLCYLLLEAAFIK